jgi:nitrite reductase/ring-hydroxylating ferredoxin subunit
MADTGIEVLESQQWLEPVAETLTSIVRGAYDRAGDTGQRLKNFAHGTWLGHPLHPVLTDIPIGAWATAAVLDATEGVTGDEGYGRAADVAIGFGLAGAVGAALTGLTDFSEIDNGAKRLGLIHGLMNIAAATLYATSLAMRRNGDRAAGRACSAAGLAVATASAYLGGALVYRDRIGVTHADEGEPAEFTRVATSIQLGEGAKRAIDADGTAVMIARQHGRVCALAEHCAHLGGPLSEGTLKDDSIVCPWHGSEFALDDGHVINGPAVHPQPCFEVREEDGEILVRRG